MRHAFVLGAAALVASCVFGQDVFAQRIGFREFDGDGFRAAAPGSIGRPRVRVVVRPVWYSDYSRTPAFFLAGHAGKIDSCWGWDGYQWLNICAGYYPGY